MERRLNPIIRKFCKFGKGFLKKMQLYSFFCRKAVKLIIVYN